MGGVISGPSWAAKQQRAYGQKNKESGEEEGGKAGEEEREEGRADDGGKKCRRVFCKGTRAQKGDLLNIAL